MRTKFDRSLELGREPTDIYCFDWVIATLSASHLHFLSASCWVVIVKAVNWNACRQQQRFNVEPIRTFRSNRENYNYRASFWITKQHAPWSTSVRTRKHHYGRIIFTDHLVQIIDWKRSVWSRVDPQIRRKYQAFTFSSNPKSDIHKLSATLGTYI